MTTRTFQRICLVRRIYVASVLLAHITMRATCGGLVLWLGWLASSATAITINVMPAPNNLTDHPDFDSNLAKLAPIMQAAADYWEGMILGNHVVDITYGYLNLDLPILGQADVQGFDAATGRPTVGAVAFDTINNANGEEREWFFDTTPTNHSEFSMHQVLVRDLNPQAQSLYYNGSPPELLEVGFWGDYNDDDQGTDMLTIALHEIGHILGLSSELPNFDNQTAADGDFDFSPNFVNGASVAAAWFAEDDQDHIRASDATMTSGFARNGDRNLPGATEVFAIASVGGWGGIDLYRKDFLAGTVWDLSGNWEGGRVPDSNDDVYVRHGGDVSILINSAARNLTIRDGSGVATNDNSLAVSGKLTVEAGPDGSDAIFTVEQGGLVTGGELEINVDGRVFVSDSTDYMPGDPVGDRINMEVIDINTGGLLVGNGLIEGDSFVNDGTITGIQPPGSGSFLSLAVGVVTPQGVGSIDLDGTSGSGQIFAGLGNVEITSPLTDPFDGEITVGAGRTIFFDHPWTLGDNSGPGDGTINLDGGADANSAATIDTAAWTAARGQINVSDFGRIDGTVTFADQIHVDVDAGSFLILSGNSTFDGGTYTGGGTIRFNGPTTIDGNTTMDVAFADLDGAGAEDSEMTIDGGVLTLNVDRIDGPNVPNRYDGTMNINCLFSQLNVQFSDPNASWTMDGDLNLNGSALPGAMGMLEGNDIRVAGTINVDGISWISANLDVEGTIDFADASAELGLSVGTRHVIRNTANVTGPGTIDVLGQALLQIENGATVDVDVENRGRLEPGTSIGAATIDGSFLQTGGGTFAVGLGGVAVGSGYDRVTVTGSADLGGTLAVSLTDAGNGFFVPAVGNSFTVLTAQGGLIDQFNTHMLPSSIGGQALDWQVAYSANNVVVRLLAITGLLGDYNNNGEVDAADYAVWRDALGSATVLAADGNQNGVVDPGDYDVWRSNFGMTAGSGAGSLVVISANAAIPEPTAITHACLAILTLLRVSVRRKFR